MGYLNRRSNYTFNKPLFKLYMIEYSNEELELSVARHIEGLIRKSKDFNLDGDIEEGQTQNIYPPPIENNSDNTNNENDSINEEDDNNILYNDNPTKDVGVKPKQIPETFLSSIVQLPVYDDKDWCPDFYIGDFKSPGSEFVEKNNDYLLSWANSRRESRGLPPIKVKWKKLVESSYMDDKALNLQNSTDVITSETRPTDGNYTCGNLWNIPELKEEYDMIKRRIMENKNDENSVEETFYDKLPRNDDGIAIFDRVQDIEKLSYEEVKRELIARGYRTHGSFNNVRDRLLDSFKDPNRQWRIENIVRKRLSKDNLELSEEVREKLKQIEEKENFVHDIEESDDLPSFTNKLAAFSELAQYYDDPVGYLNLDSGVDIQGLTAAEIEELKNSPKVEDLHFYKKINAPEVDFVDKLQKTFNLEENRPQIPLKEYEEEASIYEMKKKFLDIEEGFHEHNVGMIVDTYGVSEAFVVDALCKLGAKPPIDPTEPIRRYIGYNSIWDFLEYLNLVDPIDTHVFYSIHTLDEIADEYNLSIEDVIDACNKIQIKLPYGASTRLNMQCKSAMLHYLYKKGKLVENFPSNPYQNHPYLGVDNDSLNNIEEYKVEEEILSHPE